MLHIASYVYIDSGHKVFVFCGNTFPRDVCTVKKTTLDFVSGLKAVFLWLLYTWTLPRSSMEAPSKTATNWTEWVSSKSFEKHLNLDLLACTACVFSESSRLWEEPGRLVWTSSCHSDASEESPSPLGAEEPLSSVLAWPPRLGLVLQLFGF